jgi:hypothetical protein
MEDFQAKFNQAMGPKQSSPMPAPNMQQAGQMPQPAPSPFPTSGFQKQGASKPVMPQLMDEK